MLYRLGINDLTPSQSEPTLNNFWWLHITKKLLNNKQDSEEMRMNYDSYIDRIYTKLEPVRPHMLTIKTRLARYLEYDLNDSFCM